MEFHCQEEMLQILHPQAPGSPTIKQSGPKVTRRRIGPQMMGGKTDNPDSNCLLIFWRSGPDLTLT
jgi:hypothetical protein